MFACYFVSDRQIKSLATYTAPFFMNMKYSLRWMLVFVGLIAGLFGALLTGELMGLVIYISIVLFLFVFWVPSTAPLGLRISVLFLGVGAGLIGWCVLDGFFPGRSIGQRFYHGPLADAGGWACGVFATSLRLSQILVALPPNQESVESF